MAETTKTTITYVSPEKLGYYHQKLDAKIAAADKAIQDALDAEIIRAKAAESTNSLAAQNAQAAAEGAQAHSEALAAKVGTVPEGSTVMGIITNIQENAYDDTEIRGLISGLDTNKADKTQVSTDIAAAVKAEEDARKEAVQAVQGEVDALEQTHATDKAALENRITEEIKTVNDGIADTMSDWSFQLMQAVSQEVETLRNEDTRIVGLVEAEAARAAGVEAGLEERLVEVETFFKTAEGETIDEALDTLVELQTYLNGEGAVADQMLLDIAANKKAIEDHVAVDHDFASADSTLKAELEGKINAKADAQTVTDMEAAYKLADQNLADLLKAHTDTDHDFAAADEAIQAALQAEIDKKATIEALNAEIEARGALAEKVTALEEATAEGGEVTKAIADAQAAADQAQEEVDALEEVVATKASQEEVNTISGKVTALEGADTAIKGRLDVLEAIDHNAYVAADTSLKTELNAAIALKADSSTVSAMDTAYKAADSAMQARLDALEAVEHVEITTSEIDAWFAQA